MLLTFCDALEQELVAPFYRLFNAAYCSSVVSVLSFPLA